MRIEGPVVVQGSHSACLAYECPNRLVGDPRPILDCIERQALAAQPPALGHLLIRPSSALPAKRILHRRNWFKVVGVDAGRGSTQVIDVHSAGDRTDMQFVADAVRRKRHGSRIPRGSSEPTRWRDDSVPVVVLRPNPHPAAIAAEGALDLCVEAGRERAPLQRAGAGPRAASLSGLPRNKRTRADRTHLRHCRAAKVW